LALTSFKLERAFDKRLDWYERTDKAVLNLIEKIEIATTFQEEKGTSDQQLKRAWNRVQGAHLELGRVAGQGPLYGSRSAARQIARIEKLVQDVADKSEAFDPPKILVGEKRRALESIYSLPDKLGQARKPLMAEARRHLGLDSASFLQKILKQKTAGLDAD
jgi:hypothetical protein